MTPARTHARSDEDFARDLGARLPEVALPPELAARVHRRARAAFAGGEGARRAARIATATAVVSAVAVYLAWAVDFLMALGRG
jgi:hypothetical protein